MPVRRLPVTKHLSGLQISTKYLQDTIVIVIPERRKLASDKCDGLPSPDRLLVGEKKVICLIDVQQNTLAIQMISLPRRQVK